MLEAAGGTPDLAGLNLNISTLYLQLANYPEARLAAEHGINYSAGDNAVRPQDRLRLMIQLGNVDARQGDVAAEERLSSEAIDGAYSLGDMDAAAWAWNVLGYNYRRTGRLHDADHALTEALRLRRVFRLPGSEVPAWGLARVRADEGDLRSARTLIDSAVAALARRGNTNPAWNVYSDRGLIKLAAGDLEGAMEDLRTARRTALEWRVGVVPNDANRLSSESGSKDALVKMYSAIVEAGNRLATTHGSDFQALARETFDAMEENRAASLRALSPRANAWRQRLPPAYWEMLPRLQAAERRQLENNTRETVAVVTRVRASLNAMEAAAGSPVRIDGEGALDRTQRELGANSVLLSFQLGRRDSWLWAVTRDRVELHRLPSQSELKPLIERFRTAVARGTPEAAALGYSLYSLLFGSLASDLATCHRWILAVDEELFLFPFAALPDPVQGLEFLAERHTIEITPGALMLNEKLPAKLDGPFLAVGDPVYNRADPRWQGARTNQASPLAWLRLSSWTANAAPPSAFARLWGSGDEIRAAARAWNARENILLTGPEASNERLWSELRAQPSVIHFATHILEARETLGTGWITLSMKPTGEPTFIDPAQITARAVHAKLVTLSGCSSAAAQVRSASGLMGLTRAWIAAGAESVLATSWPTADDNGVFFSSFYRQWRARPDEGPSGALYRANLEMISSGGWRARPTFWASYFLVGND